MVDIKRHQQKGRLIAVEGLDGSGKSMQIYSLMRQLKIARVVFELFDGNVRQNK